MDRGDRLKKWLLYLKIIVNLLMYIVGLVLVFMVCPKLLKFFAPIVIGGIIAMIANPLVRLMERKVKIVRKHSSAIIIVLVILLVIGVIGGAVYYIVTKVSALMGDLPEMVDSLGQLVESASTRLQKVYDMLPGSAQNVIDSVIVNAQGKLQNLGSGSSSWSLGGTASTVAKIVEIALDSIIAILSAYFFIKERDNIVAVIKKTLPESIIQNYYIVAENFKTAFGGYFKAQFKIMGVITVILFIGLAILKVNYSFLFALLIAFLDFLPFFGTGAVLWPWAAIELFAGNIPRAVCILVIYLVCQIVRQLIQPKMVGDSIGINPFATLIFMYIGYRVYGGLGLILGIPIGMVIMKFYKIGMFDSLIKGFKIILHDLNEFRKF